jgi:hypothetical protein
MGESKIVKLLQKVTQGGHVSQKTLNKRHRVKIAFSLLPCVSKAVRHFFSGKLEVI